MYPRCVTSICIRQWSEAGTLDTRGSSNQLWYLFDKHKLSAQITVLSTVFLFFQFILLLIH